MFRYAYATSLALLVLAHAALLVGGPLTWALPLLVFGLVPAIEQLHRGSTDNPTEAMEHARLDDPWFDGLLLAVVPLQVGLLGVYLYQVTHGAYAGAELLGATATMGIACGAYGINVAHELGHRRDRLRQNAAKILLATTGYTHFFVEHNRGHHRRVATPEDPASARRGESVYAFWLRSVTGSWRSAWHLENSRCQRAHGTWLTWDNEMIRLSVLQLAGVVLVGVTLGPVALLAWAVVATMGFLLLETVNYLEHYGLSRQRSPKGRYERVQPHHSWNSNRPLGRILLFDLTRHSDHHAHAARPYAVLRHHDEAPELPAGYPAMILLALVPPLFRRQMDKALADWEDRFGPTPQPSGASSQAA